MASNQQSPPSLEELRAAKAAQEKKTSAPSLEELRAAKAAQSSKKAPEIPAVEEPTEARPPFAQPPPQQVGGEGALEALGEYAPTIKKALSSAQASPSLDIQRPSQLPEVDLQSALRPKALGSETTQQAIRPVQKELLPEEKRKEYNYYEQNYANLDERSLEERKKANASSSEQLKRMQQFFDASNQGLQLRQNQILEKQRQAEIAKQTNPLLYQRLVQEISTDAKKFDREYNLLKINSDLVNDMTEKAQMDELMTARKDYEIKSKKGNTLAGLAYSITEGIGSGLAGAAEIGFKVIPSDQQIFEFLGLAEKSDAEKTKKSIEEKLELIRSGPTYWTGSGLFTTPEFVQEDREKNLLYKGLYATADMVPALAAAYVGGSPAMMATYFTQSYDRNGQEMKGEFWDKISEPEKEAIRIGSAAVSAGISTLGFKALAGKMPIVNDIFFKAARKFVPNMTSGQIRRIIDAETKSYIGNLSSKLAQGFLIEGTEEAIDYASEEALKTIYENYKRSEFGDKADLLFNNAESIKEFGSGLADSFLVGGVVGDFVAGSMTAVTSIGARQRLNDKQFEVFKKIVGDGSLMDEFEASANAALNKGKMSRSDYDKAMEDLRVAKEVANQIPENLSTPATRKAFDLLTEKAKLKKKDQALVGERIKEIDKELSRISTEKKVAPEPTPAPKAEVVEAPAPAPAAPTKLELEAQKAEIEDKRAEELERVNIAVAEASETGASPELDGRTINPEQEINSINAKYDAEIAALAQPKPTADAVQERTTEEVGAQPVGTEGAGQEGRGGVGPGVQGPTAPQAGGPQGQVTPTAEGPVRPEAPETKTAARNAVSILASSPDVFTASDELSKKGLVMSFGGKSFFNIGGGRDAMVLNINGVPVPVYRSSQGTDSKEKGKWYPFFAMTSEWLAKAMSDNYKDGYGNKAIKDVLDALNSNPAFSYDKPLAANSIDEADLASLIFGEDQNIRDFAKSQNSGGIFDVRNYMLGAMLLDRWNNELGGISLVGATKRVQATIDALKAKNPSRADEIDETWADVLEEFRRLEQKGQEGGWTVDSFAAAISQGQKLDSPEAQQFYDNNRNQIEQRLKTIAESEKKAEVPVRPEAPPTPAAAPAPTTAPTPSKGASDKVKKLAKAERGTDTNNPVTKAKAQKKVDELLKEDARLKEVNDKFAKAVADLEKSGKLKVRCP